MGSNQDNTFTVGMDRQLEDVVERITDGILKPQVRAIQEHLFVANYLPLFVDTSGKSPIGRWVAEVAGDLYTPVAVCVGDKPLFLVPPLANDVIFSKPNRASLSAADIVAHALRLDATTPQETVRYLSNSLGPRMKITNPYLLYAAMWNQIFERYGYPTMDLGGADPLAPKVIEEKKDIFDMADVVDDFQVE